VKSDCTKTVSPAGNAAGEGQKGQVTSGAAKQRQHWDGQQLNCRWIALRSVSFLPTRACQSASIAHDFLQKTGARCRVGPSHSGAISILKAFVNGQFLDK
jgi:hypothetical protein